MPRAPELVHAEGLYQVGEWNDDDRAYVAHDARRLQRFYAAAAKAGDAMVVMFT